MKLLLVPVSLREANEYVTKHHRHHAPTRGHKFSVAVGSIDGVMRGVAIAGRPVSRHLDDGCTLEVLRVCTDGTPNACSMLYGAVRRDGGSLRASGWKLDGETVGGSWWRAGRPREDKHPIEPKQRWRAA